MKSSNKLSAFFFGIILCFVGTASYAQVEIPAVPQNHVVDLAGIVSPDTEAALNKYLLELEQKTTAQMIILTIAGLQGESLEELSISIAHDKWKLGQQGKDNGVLLLISLEDRRARFEVGYGLEGILTDAFTGRVGRQQMAPYFRQGDYSNGIAAGALVVIDAIASDAGVEISGMPRLRGRGEGKPNIFGSIFGIILLFVMTYLFIKNPRLFVLLLFANMLGGGRRGGWGGGGGFGGGGGSFGGGGGGGFGGGGSSFGW